MTVELLHTLGVIAYVLAGLFFVISLILYFVLKVPKLYSDLTGRTEKMAIAAIRQQNEEMMADGAGTTDQISSSGKLTQKSKNQSVRRVNAVESPNNRGRAATTADLFSQGGGQVENATTVLAATNETTVLSSYMDETMVLAAQPTTEETTVLNQGAMAPAMVSASVPAMTPAFTTVPQPTVPQGQWASPQVVVEVDLFFAESKELIQ